MRGPAAATNLPPLCVRAAVSSFDAQARTVELTFSTGAPVERFDWMTGKRYLEKISLEPKHVRLDRLNAGAPLLDSHSAYSIADQIGVVEEGSARIVSAKDARATVRFSARPSVEDIWNDVVAGIIRNVSMGYRVYKFEEEQGKGNALPVRTAVDWEPFEISMVPMPADTGARVRNSQLDLNACEIVTRETPMEETRQPSEFVVEDPQITPATPPAAPVRAAAAAAAEPNDRDLGAAQERRRVQGILVAVRAARLPATFADTLIGENLTLEQAQSRVFVEMGRREPSAPNGTASAEHATRVEVVGDPLVHSRAGITEAILHRVAPQYFTLTDAGREYRGMNLLDIARSYLNARGVRTTGMSKMEVAGYALGLNVRGGMHTTSDFANLLADVANKTLRQAYAEAPQTFSVISRRVTLPDFKPVKRLQLGEAPDLQVVDEHGEFTRGTIGEGKEQFQLTTYGRVFGITRKSLVNDDTDAFSRIPMLFGRAARKLESSIVWEQITSNPTMGDGNALFSAAHANLQTDGDHIAIASLSRARSAMRLQTGLDGDTLLDLVPKFLIVPPSLETIADQYTATITPALGASVNPFSGRLTVICEPRLEASSALAWYLAASPDQIDIIEHGYLEGEEGPMVESRVGFDVDGLEIKARLDFAAKVIDWRGLHKDPGDLAS